MRRNEVAVEPDGKALRYRAVVPQEQMTKAIDQPGASGMDSFIGRFGPEA